MRRIGKLLGSAACAGLIVAALTASSASATTIDFTFENAGTDVATGSFSYTSANPVLSFADLDTFDIQIGTSHYDLNFVESFPFDENAYFQFNVGSQSFDHAPQPGLFGLDTTLVSMSGGFDGFIFVYDPDNRYFSDNASGVFHSPWTDVVFQQEVTVGDTPVPEPVTIAVLGAGLAGSVAMRRRKKKAA